MPGPKELRTERLLLREWQEADRGWFAAMNADRAVMEYFPSVLDRAASDALFDRIARHWADHGIGLYAVEASIGPVGFVGLTVPRFDLPLPHRADPPVEIGWRLARRAWGRGYASEGAAAVLPVAFTDQGLPEVVSFTTPANVRSRAVMERIGMRHDPADVFEHPALDEDSPLRSHVLYRMASEDFATLGP